MIDDAIFSKVGYDEAVVLTWTIHDMLEHVPIGLLLAGVWDNP
jgi:uncharacterized membrane protein